MSRALGVDVGTERTGIAVEVVGIAQPLRVLTASGDDLVPAVVAIAREEAATEIVIGHPLRMDGNEGPAAVRAREIADAVRNEAGLPVVLWDERLTTVQAERTLVGAGVRRRKRRTVIDKLAATVLLQSYLDSGRPAEGTR
ncbi:MAG: Holliday junction resolvase RuvX [Actinomycetota bacterium]